MATIRRLHRRHFLGATTSAFVLARFGAGCAPGEDLPAADDLGPNTPTGDTSPPVQDAAGGRGPAEDVDRGRGSVDATGSSEPVLAEPISPLTPNEDFYTVSFSGPPHEGWDTNWVLTLGAPGAEVDVDLATLKTLGSETVEHTLECIGNGPPGKALSNAEWTGIRFGALLEALEVSVPEDSQWLAFECGDGYTTFLPLDDALFDIILVWAMNGEPLPVDHGAPLRALVPGRYGMKNPKWLRKMTFTAEQPVGFWESFGWSAEARYRVHSWVRTPHDGDTLPAEGITLLGSAHAGSVPIARVEISTDGGESWEDAELTYNGPPNAWSLWRYQWIPGASGTYTVVARATDVDGRVQSLDDGDNLAGWQGLHTLEFEVT